jgi:hypothetical protein
VKRGSVVAAFLDAGTWSAVFGLAWNELMLHDSLTSQRMVRPNGTYLRKVAGTGGIPEGRNECVRNFLDHTDGEWLFFIDTDMGFDPDTVDRLVESAVAAKANVMGGLCFALRKMSSASFKGIRHGIIPTVYQWVELEDESGFVPIAGYGRDQVIEVGATGAACVLIHRRVLTQIRESPKGGGDVWFDPITHPTANPGRTPRTFSEDLSFCIRVAAVGERVLVDTRVKTTHDKHALFLDEDLFLEQQERHADRTTTIAELKEREPCL